MRSETGLNKVSRQTHPLTVSGTVCPRANRHQTFPGPCSSLQLILSSVTAGGCHLKASLHPHILTFCKHVWLYRLTLPPSGRATQAGGRHAALWERAHSSAPRRRWRCPPLFSPPLFPKASGHWYCHLLFSTSLVKWLSRAGAFCSFSVTSVPY